MKAYVCDICDKPVSNPYSANMIEFCFTVSNCDLYQMPEQTKRKVKLHLCGNCFKLLKDIAKGKIKRRDDNG